MRRPPSRTHRIAGALIAAAVLVWLWMTMRSGLVPGNEPHVASAPPDSIESGADQHTAPERSFLEAVRGVLSGANEAPGSDTEEANETSDTFRFRVAYGPPDFPTGDQRTIKAFEAMHAAFLDTLDANPELVLIELQDADLVLTPDDADFVLAIRGRLETAQDPIWSYTAEWTATRQGEGAVTRSQNESNLRAIELLGSDAATALLRYPFPPLESRTLELVALSLDTSLPDTEREAAIDELRDIPRRFELTGRDAERMTAVAAAEIVAGATEPAIRAQTWRAMIEADVADPYLIGPLLDSLLLDPNEEVRRAAVKLLSREFNDDENVRSALDYALNNDSSQQVRTLARWEFLDEAERREHVNTTLLNANLAPAERLELLIADIEDLHGYVDRQRSMSALNLAVMTANGQESTRRTQSMSPDMEQMLPMLIEVLTENENESLRAAAASMLVGFRDDPRVSAALEQAAESDASFVMRMNLLGMVQR